LEAPVSGSNPRIQLFIIPNYLQNEDKVWWTLRSENNAIGLMNLRKKIWAPPVSLGSPIFIKQLKFDPTVWKTVLRLFMEVQLTNMLKPLHKRIEFFHFFK
jgi:hypothetical protein